MKQAARFTALFFLFCMSTLASAQDLTMYAEMGKLRPHSPTITDGYSSSLLVYKKQGVLFHILSEYGAIVSVAVFPSTAPPRSLSSLNREGYMVPGVGGYGLPLGTSRGQVTSTPSLQGIGGVPSGKGAEIYQFGGMKTLTVHYAAEKVSQVSLFGAFSTPEGITDRSTVADIQRVYGTPDEYYDLKTANVAGGMVLAMLFPPIVGLITGLVIRFTRSGLSERRRGLVWLAGIGALGLSVADVLSGIGFRSASGLPADFHMMPWNLLGAVLTGAGGVLILETLSDKMGGCLGWGSMFCLMPITAAVSTWLVRAINPVPELDLGVIGLLASGAPFLVCMFLTAGMRRP